MNLFLILVTLWCVGVLIWNFVPSVRKRLRGYTSVLENISGGVILAFEAFTGAAQDLVDSGYLPENWIVYVPFLILAVATWQRIKTNTGIGRAK